MNPFIHGYRLNDDEKKKYFETSKAEIEKNIETITKLDKKFNFLFDNNYYTISNFYNVTGNKAKAEYYEKLAKSSNRIIETLCLSGTYSASSEELYKQPYSFYDNK